MGVLDNDGQQHSVIELSYTGRGGDLRRESRDANGISETHGMLQNGSQHEEPPGPVNGHFEEDLQVIASVAAATALPTTCGCEPPSTEHLDHLDSLRDFEARFTKALSSLPPSQQQYDEISVVSVCWSKSDIPALSKHAKDLQDVFEDSYGYKVSRCVLQNDKDGINKISIDFRKLLSDATQAISDSGKQNLFILHYIGHGGRYEGEVPGTFEYFWQPTKTSRERAFNWSAEERSLTMLSCDILLLFDCCHAGGMIRDENAAKNIKWQRRIELVGSAGSLDQAEHPRGAQYTLTNAFAKELEDRKDGKGTDVFYIHQHMSGNSVSQLYNLKPAQVYKRNHETSHSYSSSIFLQSKIKAQTPMSQTAIEPADYARELSCLNDLRVVLTLRFTNPAERLLIEDFKRWFHYRPHNIDLAKVGVKVECWGLGNSNSSLVVLSIPMWVWNLLPPSPAYESVGVVRSKNLALAYTDAFKSGGEAAESKALARPYDNISSRQPVDKGKAIVSDHLVEGGSASATDYPSTQEHLEIDRPMPSEPPILAKGLQTYPILAQDQGMSYFKNFLDGRQDDRRRMQNSQWQSRISSRVRHFDNSNSSITESFLLSVRKLGRQAAILRKI